MKISKLFLLFKLMFIVVNTNLNSQVPFCPPPYITNYYSTSINIDSTNFVIDSVLILSATCGDFQDIKIQEIKIFNYYLVNNEEIFNKITNNLVIKLIFENPFNFARGNWRILRSEYWCQSNQYFSPCSNNMLYFNVYSEIIPCDNSIKILSGKDNVLGQENRPPSSFKVQLIYLF